MAPTVYTSRMHGERTQVEVYSRIPDAGLKCAKMGVTELLHLRCGTVSIRREAADVRHRTDHMSTFILQVAGHGAFRHYGNRVELNEGDFVLCDNSAQYELRLEGTNEIIMFRVPTAMLKHRIPSVKSLCGRSLRAREGLASTAAAMALDLVRKDAELLDNETGARAGQYLLDVLACSFSGLIDKEHSASAIVAGHYCRVKLFIEDHLRDPDLSPASVARRLNFSSRYLRMIFSAGEESPSAYILRRRLEECAAQLRDPRWRNHSITDIAFGWGFNSGPHFARSFRARFACSPRDYRCQLAEQGAALN
jgi:AraC-like DNA-binding protein